MKPPWEGSPVSVGVLLQIAGSPGLPPAQDFRTSAQARNGLRPSYKSANVSRGQFGARVSMGARGRRS